MEKRGYFLPVGAVRAWKDALASYARQIPKLELMGKLARRRMELLFDAKHYAHEMVDLYVSALCEPLDSK